jgi:cyclopropane fatty-acyl-phospholipid synthase-like methyltransferase
MRWKSNFDLAYDDLIFDPVARSYFGDDNYYNAGYWAPGETNPSEASRVLTDRVIACVPPDAAVIADVGCGLGATTRRLHQLRPESRLIAVNFSLRQLAACRTNCPTAEPVQMDAACLALASSSVDAIVSVEAPFHFCTRRDFLCESARVIRSGGTLAMADILFSAAGWPGSWTVPEENFLPDPEAYTDLLAASGFEEIHIEDATERCWAGFCDGQEAWSQQCSLFDEDKRRWWRDCLAELRRGVTHYLLISARRGRF